MLHPTVEQYITFNGTFPPSSCHPRIPASLEYNPLRQCVNKCSIFCSFYISDHCAITIHSLHTIFVFSTKSWYLPFPGCSLVKESCIKFTKTSISFVNLLPALNHNHCTKPFSVQSNPSVELLYVFVLLSSACTINRDMYAIEGKFIHFQLVSEITRSLNCSYLEHYHGLSDRVTLYFLNPQFWCTMSHLKSSTKLAGEGLTSTFQ